MSNPMGRRSWSDYPVSDRVVVGFRAPRAVKAKLQQMAAASGRSLAAEVERLIELGMLADRVITIAIEKD